MRNYISRTWDKHFLTFSVHSLSSQSGKKKTAFNVSEVVLEWSCCMLRKIQPQSCITKAWRRALLVSSVNRSNMKMLSEYQPRCVCHQHLLLLPPNGAKKSPCVSPTCPQQHVTPLVKIRGNRHCHFVHRLCVFQAVGTRLCRGVVYRTCTLLWKTGYHGEGSLLSAVQAICCGSGLRDALVTGWSQRASSQWVEECHSCSFEKPLVS